jgi:hypothetical protein
MGSTFGRGLWVIAAQLDLRLRFISIAAQVPWQGGANVEQHRLAREIMHHDLEGNFFGNVIPVAQTPKYPEDCFKC